MSRLTWKSSTDSGFRVGICCALTVTMPHPRLPVDFLCSANLHGARPRADGWKHRACCRRSAKKMEETRSDLRDVSVYLMVRTSLLERSLVFTSRLFPSCNDLSYPANSSASIGYLVSSRLVSSWS
mmetsp:Transcript_37651/g.118918  ORF Transcript_37651/g.118918 Transcript_37651/m.118918 type:complete len:126 (+) Transcript_37651:1254-1631(+)